MSISCEHGLLRRQCALCDAIQENSELRARIAELERAKENLIQQAEMQAQEARTQRGIVMAIGELVGCDRDWEMVGAVKGRIAELEAQLNDARTAVDDEQHKADSMRDYCRELEAQQRAGVPEEPTVDMVQAGLEVYGLEDCVDADVRAIYAAMLAASPAPKAQEQAEFRCDKCNSGQQYFTRYCLNCKGDYTLRREQALQLAVAPKSGETLEARMRKAGGGGMGPAPQPAEVGEQGVAALVEALELARNDLSDWITSFPEAAHTHTTIVIARIDAALAAYRKGGGV